MSTTVVNGAPMTVFYGTDDQSTRVPIREPESRPTHLPLFLIYAKKGREDMQFLIGGSRDVSYGAETFDETSKYATHQTVGANIVNGAGNLCAYKRMRPADANGPSTIRLSVDILKTDIPEYDRNDDGSYKVDSFGEKIETGSTIAGGHIVKWVVSEAIGGIGEATQEPGDQTDGNNVSVRYPVADIEVDSFGSYGNNLGITLWAPTQSGTDPIDTRILSEEKVYPFRVAAVERRSERHNGKPLDTLTGEPYLNVTFKENVSNPFTLREMSIDDIFIEAYQDIDSVGTPPQYGPFGKIYIYRDQIETFLEELYLTEIDYIDEYSDITGDNDDEIHLINFVSGVSSYNVPYQSIVMNGEDPNAFVLTSVSTAYAAGGSDGTMSEDLLAELAIEEYEKFTDRNHEYQNMAKYPISIIYDTGWPLATKFAQLSTISVRKDILSVVSTYDVNGGELTSADESSIAQALKTRAQMYPESEYYGTSTMRAAVVPRYGKMLGTKYRKKLPITIEFAQKMARFMGSGARRWDSALSPEGDPNNKVRLFVDINNTFTPAQVRNRDWDNGIVAVLDFDRSEAFFPAYKTVYDNDTSILNSFITASAIAELEKVGERVWAELSGRSDLSELTLIKQVNDRFSDKVKDVFAGRFIITSNAYFTAEDRARGYSWTNDVTIYSPTMYTVQRLTIIARRMSDLE